jgi:serine/threonine-protein kinase RsbW
MHVRNPQTGIESGVAVVPGSSVTISPAGTVGQTVTLSEESLPITALSCPSLAVCWALAGEDAGGHATDLLRIDTSRRRSRLAFGARGRLTLRESWMVRVADRAAAHAARKRAQVLRARTEELRAQLGDSIDAVIATLLGSEDLRLGDQGDTFSLRLVRVSSTLGLMRRALLRWLEARGVADGEARSIVLACSEACANAVEHPSSGRPAFQIDVTVVPSEQVKVVVRDFGTWRVPRKSATRGRGLAMIRSLMDDVAIVERRAGTEVTMLRRLGTP